VIQVLHPELADRDCLRTALLEQATRDRSVLELSRSGIDAIEGFDEHQVLMMDMVGGLSDIWAFLANSVDGGCRWHGFERTLDELGFRPYLAPSGHYSMAGNEEEELRSLVVGMIDAITHYVTLIEEDHDVEDNLLLGVMLVPTLREKLRSILRFFDVEVHETLSPEQLRAQLIAEKLAKLASALRCFACLFPQEADVRAAQVDEYNEGTPVHAGRLNDILEPDELAGESVYMFKVLQNVTS